MAASLDGYVFQWQTSFAEFPDYVIVPDIWVEVASRWHPRMLLRHLGDASGRRKIAQRRYFAATLSFLFQVYYDSLIPHSCLEANIRGVPLQEGNKTVGSQVLLELLRSSAVKRTGNSACRVPFGSFRRPTFLADLCLKGS